MTSKIRIKMGQIEVDYEGSENFLKQELPDLLAAVSKLHRESGQSVLSGENGGNEDETDSSGTSKGKLDLTTRTIAGKLNCKAGAGRELIIAAAARLTLVSEKGTFTRKELLAEAKGATNYYKKSVNSNLSTTLKRLCDSDEFTEHSADKYALTATKRKELEKLLAP